MYSLTEEEIDQIIKEQEDKVYDEYVELLQDLEWSRSTVDIDAEINAFWEEYGIEGPMY